MKQKVTTRKAQHGFCYDVIISYCAVTESEIHFSETVGCGYNATFFSIDSHTRQFLTVFLINKKLSIY